MSKTLPLPTSSDAPYFDGRPENLLQYLNDVHSICTTAEVSDEDMMAYTIAYAARGAVNDAAHWIQIYYDTQGSYERFIVAIFRLYHGIYASSFFCGAKMTERALRALYGPNASYYMSDSTATCSDYHSEVPEHDSDNANTTESPSSASTPLSPSIDQCSDTEEVVVSFVANPVGPQCTATSAPENVIPDEILLSLDLDTADFAPSASEHDTMKEVAVFIADLEGLQFPTDNLEDIAPDPTLIDLECTPVAPESLESFAFSELDGITFDLPEVPLTPPGLSLRRSSSLLFADIASDKSSTLAVSDSDSEVSENLCHNSHSMRPSLSAVVLSSLLCLKNCRSYHCSPSHVKSLAPDHTRPDPIHVDATTTLMRFAPYCRYHSLYPMQPPRRRREGSQCKRRRKRRVWQKRRRRR
jgi:hypothetical protein